MSNMYMALAVLFFFAIAGQSEAANRCVIGGKTVIQAEPCPGSFGTMGDAVRKAEEKRTAERHAAEDAARLEDSRCRVSNLQKRIDAYAQRRPDLKAKMDQGEIWVGMPEQAAKIILCHAIKQTNTNETLHGTSEQLVIDGYPARFVYIANGIVTGIQR